MCPFLSILHMCWIMFSCIICIWYVQVSTLYYMYVHVRVYVHIHGILCDQLCMLSPSYSEPLMEQHVASNIVSSICTHNLVVYSQAFEIPCLCFHSLQQYL